MLIIVSLCTVTGQRQTLPVARDERRLLPSHQDGMVQEAFRLITARGWQGGSG